MNKFLLFLAVFISINAFSQINIGQNDMNTTKPIPFKESDITLLSKTTTLFVYRKGDESNIEEFKKSLTSVWDISTLEFISVEEYESNKYDQSYSFITISGYNLSTSRGTYYGAQNTSTSTFVYLSLWLQNGDETISYFRIELFPSFKSITKMNSFTHKDKNKALEYMYGDAEIRNWNLGFIKNYLAFINKNLKEKKTQWMYESQVKPEIKKLKTNTLYIPDYVLIEMKKMSGDESNKFSASDIMKGYPYDYKIVSNKELSELILESSEPIYYLIYVRSVTDKFVTIVNSETSEIIYSSYKPISYNFKNKDIKNIVKSMK